MPHYGINPSKINKLQYLFLIPLQNMGQQQMCPSNATNIPHVQITWHAVTGELCQYTQHIWGCFHQSCSQNHCTKMMMTMPVTIMPQPGNICAGHLAKSVKNLSIFMKIAQKDFSKYLVEFWLIWHIANSADLIRLYCNSWWWYCFCTALLVIWLMSVSSCMAYTLIYFPH